MSSQTVARRYAVALADVVVKQGVERQIQKELFAWEEIIQSNTLLQEVFSNPTIPYEQKANVLRDLIARTKVSQTTANFLQLLLRNQRLTELTDINKRFAQVLDERSGVVGAHVTSARPVPEAAKNSLRDKLKALSGREVRLSFATDESLIGGLITRIGSTIYDGSIRSQLQKLEEHLAGK